MAAMASLRFFKDALDLDNEPFSLEPYSHASLWKLRPNAAFFE